MTSTPVSDRELVLSRLIDAPREKVYRAWTDAEILKQWFAPKPWSTPHAELDVRPGGATLVVMSDPDDEADHAFARAAVDRLCTPVRFLPGNHDVGDNIVNGNMSQRVNAERMGRFRKRYGEDHWSFEAAGWGFVGVNAQLFGSNGSA